MGGCDPRCAWAAGGWYLHAQVSLDFVQHQCTLVAALSLLAHPVTKDYFPPEAFADERKTKPMAYMAWYTTAWLALLFGILFLGSLLVPLLKLKAGTIEATVVGAIVPISAFVLGFPLCKPVGQWAFAYGAKKELGPNWKQLTGLDTEEGRMQWQRVWAGKGAENDSNSELKERPLLSDDHLAQ